MNEIVPKAERRNLGGFTVRPLARGAAFNHSEHNGLSRRTTDKPQRGRKERRAEPRIGGRTKVVELPISECPPKTLGAALRGFHIRRRQHFLIFDPFPFLSTKYSLSANFGYFMTFPFRADVIYGSSLPCVSSLNHSTDDASQLHTHRHSCLCFYANQRALLLPVPG